MHLTEISHPTQDPELVSYVRPELRCLEDQLEITRDCFSLMRTGEGTSCLSAYLPKEPDEPDAAYQGRLGRASYTSAFRDSIRAFAGVLSQYQLKELPATLEDNQDNVDLLGSSLAKYLNHLDQMVLRDGGVAVLVEMPQAQEGIESAKEEQDLEIRPYLLTVERSNLINWRTRMQNGREVIEQAVVRMLQEKPMQEGQFGAELEPVYLHLKPGYFCKYRLERGLGGKWMMEKLEEGYTSLDHVPLIWYGASGSKFGTGEVPLIAMANLSIQHLQMRSDLAELIHKLSMPAAIRKGATQLVDGTYPDLVLGPNSAIDLPVDGDFFFAEPKGTSLASHQDEIKHVEQLMDRSSLAFLFGGDGGMKTATEVMLSGAQVAAQVTTLIENKQSLFSALLEIWSEYANEELDEEAGLEVSDNLIQRPLDPGETQAIIALFSQNVISHQTTLEELQRGHALSDQIDIEEELARVEEEKKKAQEEAIALMQEQANDVAGDAPPMNKNASAAEIDDDDKGKDGKPVKGAAAANKAKAKAVDGGRGT